MASNESGAQRLTPASVMRDLRAMREEMLQAAADILEVGEDVTHQMGVAVDGQPCRPDWLLVLRAMTVASIGQVREIESRLVALHNALQDDPAWPIGTPAEAAAQASARAAIEATGKAFAKGGPWPIFDPGDLGGQGGAQN